MNCLAIDMAVAIDPHNNGFKLFSRPSQRCRLQSLTNLDYNFLESNNKQTNLAHSLNRAFEDGNIPRSVSTPCFSITAAAKLEEDFQTRTNPRIKILGGQRMPTVRALVAEVAMAMVSGVEPLPLPSGLGGVYLLRTRKGQDIAVAKPIDEEPLALNNPKGFGGLMFGQPGMKKSIRVGETGIRELAAYLLDHQGFAGVPPTALVRISDVSFHVSDAFQLSTTPYKIASLQRYVGHDFDAGELGPGSFSVASVHRMGILDIRILNLDRHAGNMLVKRHDQDEGNPVGMAELVPIDHGLCLPEWLDDPYFEWLNWPQASVPFTDSELQYISDLDPFKDAELLRTELPSVRESSIQVLIVCTIFLKQAATAGLCLADIGKMMTREFCGGEESSSVLEILCAKAKASVVGESDDDGDYSNNENDVETEVESGIFQFDDEFGDSSHEIELSEVFQMSKPPMIPKFPHVNSIPANLCAARLSSPTQWTTDHDKMIREWNTDNADDKNSEERRKAECITRSMSHPICMDRDESGGVFFGDMAGGEWKIFLESFEKLLPEAFESSKGQGSKPRFGSSCKF